MLATPHNLGQSLTLLLTQSPCPHRLCHRWPLLR